MCRISPDCRFEALGAPQRIWTIAAVHGDADRLTSLHDALLERMQPGDRLLYFGNYTGYGTQNTETLDEILTFRRLALSRPGMNARDIIYLRGGQEEMWHKLLQLQFHRNPLDLFLWMLGNGMDTVLQSYGIEAQDGIRAIKEGVVSLTRWTQSIREALRRHSGHDVFMTQYRRAAYTGTDDGRFPVLFVNAGIDPARPLDQQDEEFWWGGAHFPQMTQAYAPFEKVIRGFDPLHQGIYVNCVTASLDGGCGFGGNLVCSGMDTSGEIFEILEA